MYKTNTPDCWEHSHTHRNQTHPMLSKTVCSSLHISKHPPLWCVTHRWQPYQGVITQLSPTVWGVSALLLFFFFQKGCQHHSAVKLKYSFIFPSWRIVFCVVKREVQIRSEGRVESRSAMQIPFHKKLIFFWVGWSVSTIFIISLWVELTVTLLR